MNTSVTREGKDFDTNNQALVFDLYDNKKKYNVNIYSKLCSCTLREKGFRGAIEVSELNGNFRPAIGWLELTRNINRMILVYRTNKPKVSTMRLEISNF